MRKFNGGWSAKLVFLNYQKLHEVNNMKAQVVFEASEIDYYAVYERIRSHPKVAAAEQNEKGMIWVRLSDPSGIIVLISPKGTIQFAYNRDEERRRTLKVVEEVLGEHVTIKLTYEVKPIRYVGCPPEKELAALVTEVASRIAVFPFIRRKRFGKNVEIILKRRPFMKIRKGKPLLNSGLKRLSCILERLEPPHN